jgi:hypothetical protein
MSWSHLLRRPGWIGLLAASLSVSAVFAQGSAALPPGTHFRAIKVDVGPVERDVGDPTASWIAQDLPPALQATFATRLAPGDRAAPTLVVRIDHVFLAESGGVVSPLGEVEARDSIEGAGVVMGPQGQTLGVYPLFTTLNNFTGGSNYEAALGPRRVNDLAKAFAYWLPGQMGL